MTAMRTRRTIYLVILSRWFDPTMIFKFCYTIDVIIFTWWNKIP